MKTPKIAGNVLTEMSCGSPNNSDNVLLGSGLAGMHPVECVDKVGTVGKIVGGFPGTAVGMIVPS